MAEDRDDIVMRSAPEFDASRGLAKFSERVERDGVVAGRSWTAAFAERFTPSAALRRPAIAAVATVALLFTATATGIAETILTVFEPQQVQTITVDPSEFGNVPDPSEYGTLTWIAEPEPREVADAAAAEAVAGFRALVPSALPAGVTGPVVLQAMPEAKATFQFDESKARAAAAKVGASIPPMPAAIAATTLTMTGGPAVLQRYEKIQIVQAKAPVVISNGASVTELRDYALAQPGIPPSVAAQIRAIGDPVRTMLIPIGVDADSARSVTVRGTQGYLFGDNTGLGSGVIWLEDGYVFAAMGALKESDLLAMVSSMR